ncbi:MAG: hypothetical protein ACI82H_000852 [Alphaproteobacteria bacterium]|jgi:hypothetical protein
METGPISAPLFISDAGQMLAKADYSRKIAISTKTTMMPAELYIINLINKFHISSWSLRSSVSAIMFS